MEKAFASNEAGKETAPIIKRLLAALNKPVSSSEETKNGSRLPESFLQLFGYNGLNPNEEAPEIKMNRPGFLGLDSDLMPEQRVMRAAVREFAKSRPDLLTNLTNERANTVPPTVADYLIFSATIEGLGESPELQRTGEESEPRKRNRVERFFNKLKQFRRIATRYDKLSKTFFAAIYLVAAFLIIRNS